MEILGNLVHPLKSILVTGELPDSVGDQDDKLPAHQLGLSVLCTQMEGEGEQKKEEPQRKLSGSHAVEKPMAGSLLQERMLQFLLQMKLCSASPLGTTPERACVSPFSCSKSQGLYYIFSLYSHPHSASCSTILTECN